MKSNPGTFITFEGTEGAGKSTLIRKVQELLLAQGRSVFMTREPGGTELAERIRDLILKEKMHPRTELLLYEAARVEHVETKILPALESGSVVLCDRFTDSTLAYQSFARGLDRTWVKRLNTFATGNLTPTLSVLLDIDPAKGLARVREANRFEAEGVAFQTLVRKGFLKSVRETPARWLVLKTEGKTPDELARAVLLRMKKAETRQNPKSKKKGVRRGRKT